MRRRVAGRLRMRRQGRRRLSTRSLPADRGLPRGVPSPRGLPRPPPARLARCGSLPDDAEDLFVAENAIASAGAVEDGGDEAVARRDAVAFEPMDDVRGAGHRADE